MKKISAIKKIIGAATVGAVVLTAPAVYAEEASTTSETQSTVTESASDMTTSSSNSVIQETTTTINNGVKTEIEELNEEKQAKEQELKSLEDELTQVLAKIGELDKKASELNARIYENNIKLDEQRKIRDAQYDDMKLRIKYMYENRQRDFESIFFEYDNMADALNAANYFNTIYDYDRNKLNDIDNVLQTIQELSDSLTADFNETEKIKSEMKQEEEKLEKLVAEKESDLRLINSGISAAAARMHQAQSERMAYEGNATALLAIATEAQKEALASGKANEKQIAVARNAGAGLSTYPLDYGWCAAWVSGVYAYTGGITPPHGDAIDYWNKWQSSGSTRTDNIPIGACVISSGDPTYGHIGIYLGGGVVASNLGYCKIETVESFGSVTAVCQGHMGFIGWVWPNGTPIQ